MIVREFYVKIDYSQQDYLTKIGEVINKIYNPERHREKVIIIRDNEFQIEERILVEKESPVMKQTINSLIYFIKKQAQSKKKMNLFKESVKSSINLSNDDEEYYQLRTKSMLCEYIQQQRYICKRKNKIIRKSKLPDSYLAASIGEMSRKSAISLVHKDHPQINLIYYCITTGKMTDLQLPLTKYSNNRNTSILVIYRKISIFISHKCQIFTFKLLIYITHMLQVIISVNFIFKLIVHLLN